MRFNVLLIAKTRSGMEEGSLGASSWEGKNGEGRQQSFLMGGRWDSLHVHMPLSPRASRGDEVEGDFPGGNLSLSWPVQSRNTTACQNVFGWWYDNAVRERKKKKVRFLTGGVPLTKKGKVNCFWCKWRNVIPKCRLWELSRQQGCL